MKKEDIVLQFKSRRESQKLPLEIKSKDSSSLDAKINTAKKEGLKELKKCRELIENIEKELNDTALMAPFAKAISQTYLSLIDDYIEPIFKGQMTYGINEKAAKLARTEMMVALIHKYTKEDE